MQYRKYNIYKINVIILKYKTSRLINQMYELGKHAIRY